MVAWPMDKAPEVLRFLREFLVEAPDEIGVMANLRLAPPLPAVPQDLWGKPIAALIVTYTGPIDQGRDALAPLRELPTPAFDAVMPKPSVAHPKMFDAAYPHGWHYYWKAHKLGPLTDDIIDVIVEHAARVTSPLSAVPIFCFGGAGARVPKRRRRFPTVMPPTSSTSWRRGCLRRLAMPTATSSGRGGFSALEPYSRGV
jgi:hypothetical protein